MDQSGLDEERWCQERRAQVAEYLRREGVRHGRIGEWRAWHVAPYVSVWAIESATLPESVGWWVICGDGPTDYRHACPSENRCASKDLRVALHDALQPRHGLYRTPHRRSVRSGALEALVREHATELRGAWDEYFAE